MDSVTCAALPIPASCASNSTVSVVTMAVYASVAGIVLAMLLAAAVGVSTARSPKPNVALAKLMDQDEYHLEGYRARRAQLDEWTVMAQARAAELAARAEAA